MGKEKAPPIYIGKRVKHYYDNEEIYSRAYGVAIYYKPKGYRYYFQIDIIRMPGIFRCGNIYQNIEPPEEKKVIHSELPRNIRNVFDILDLYDS